MKNLALTIVCLVGIAAFLSCNKEKPNDAVYPWQFNFVLIDSLGNKLFPEPPPNFRTLPFDPSKSYWIDGLGVKNSFYLQGNDSTCLIFPMARQLKELNLDPNYVNNQQIHWKVFLHPDSVPIDFIVKNPKIGTGHADFVIWNGDTLKNYYRLGLNEIKYP